MLITTKAKGKNRQTENKATGRVHENISILTGLKIDGGILNIYRRDHASANCNEQCFHKMPVLNRNYNSILSFLNK